MRARVCVCVGDDCPSFRFFVFSWFGCGVLCCVTLYTRTRTRTRTHRNLRLRVFMATTAAGGGRAAARKRVLELETKRHAIENEISALVRELNTPTETGGAAPGVKGKLTDEDGFPRSDVDHYVVRHQRKRLNCLKTDLVELMREIENGLLLVMGTKEAQEARNKPQVAAPQGSRSSWRAALRAETSDPEPTTTEASPSDAKPGVAGVSKTSPAVTSARGACSGVPALPAATAVVSEDAATDTSSSTSSAASIAAAAVEAAIPFAVVNDVAAGGPAKEAGLRVGDKLVAFGEATSANHAGLRKVAEEAQLHQSSSVKVIVLRHDATLQAQQLVELELRPRSWAGRGLIGSHILPL